MFAEGGRKLTNDAGCLHRLCWSKHLADVFFRCNLYMARLDLLFTYWVLLWSIVYVIVYEFSDPNPVSMYFITYFNPLFALIVETVIMTCVCLCLLLYGVRFSILGMFVGMNLLTKGVPIYLLWGSPIHGHDVAVSAGVLALYCVYLWMQGTNPWKVYSALLTSVQNGTYRPFLLACFL